MAETKKKFLDLEGLGIVVTKIMDGTVHSVNGRKGAVTITKTDVALGNVTNDAQVKRSEMGKAGGVATLDTAGKVPSSQLPSYVDDVLEYDTKAGFPATGETGKIYVDKATNKTYRWSGTAYVEISASIALGETSSTAYAGDKGKKNAADIAALNTAIDAHNAHIADLITDVNGLKESSADLTPRVEAAESDIEHLQERVESAAEKIDNIRVFKQGNVVKGARHTVASIEEPVTAADNVAFSYTDLNMQTMAPTAMTRTIPAATATAAGVMTAAQVNALIKAQSDITKLDTDLYDVSDNLVEVVTRVNEIEPKVTTLESNVSAITAITTAEIDALFS